MQAIDAVNDSCGNMKVRFAINGFGRILRVHNIVAWLNARLDPLVLHLRLHFDVRLRTALIVMLVQRCHEVAPIQSGARALKIKTPQGHILRRPGPIHIRRCPFLVIFGSTLFHFLTANLKKRLPRLVIVKLLQRLKFCVHRVVAILY